MQREHCLLEDEKVKGAIQNLLYALGDDNFRNGLKACKTCNLGMPSNVSTNLHCELKSVYDYLASIEAQVDKLLESKNRIPNQPI